MLGLPVFWTPVNYFEFGDLTQGNAPLIRLYTPTQGFSIGSCLGAPHVSCWPGWRNDSFWQVFGPNVLWVCCARRPKTLATPERNTPPASVERRSTYFKRPCLVTCRSFICSALYIGSLDYCYSDASRVTTTLGIILREISIAIFSFFRVNLWFWLIILE